MALREELSPDEDVLFREWLAASASNREQYERLQRIWKEGMTDYALYREANEDTAWEALRAKMGGEIGEAKEESRRAIPMGRWMAAAVGLLMAAGAGWWFAAGKGSITKYETAAGEQQTISLPDGSKVVLNGQARIEIDRNYDKTNRAVVLVSGNVHFQVSHQDQRPFTVDMGTVSVKDIGTIFTIGKAKDSINVVVSEGKIAFIEKESGQSRELSAGDSLCYYTAEHRVVEIRTRFDNAPLSEVITALQRMSGKNVLLNDTTMAQKRLTVHLAGESFEDALKTVCASLNLEYEVISGAYVLKSREAAIHK